MDSAGIQFSIFLILIAECTYVEILQMSLCILFLALVGARTYATWAISLCVVAKLVGKCVPC